MWRGVHGGLISQWADVVPQHASTCIVCCLAPLLASNYYESGTLNFHKAEVPTPLQLIIEASCHSCSRKAGRHWGVYPLDNTYTTHHESNTWPQFSLLADITADITLDRPVCMLSVSYRSRFKDVTLGRRPAGVSKASTVLGFIPPPGHAADICCCAACRYVLCFCRLRTCLT
jgi:hypothetical protein